jgi:methyl-accepting chemotaxis protein
MKLFAEPNFFLRSLRPSQQILAEPLDSPPAEKPHASATLEQAEGIERQKENIDLLEIDVVRLIGEVMRAGSGAHNDISALAISTSDISAGSAELAGSAEDAARHARRLAEASMELKASGEEINRRLQEVGALAIEGKQATEDTHAGVAGLKTSSGEIGSIVGLISSIARKIDLVALNAMIEAARAGDSGKGFVVVANEVKSLASATQKATDDIARRVEKLQSDASRLIASVERIGGLIESLSPVILAISGAVEIQTEMTSDLSASTDEASTFANDVRIGADAIAKISTKTALTAVSADKSVQRVLRDAEKLRSRFIVFLRQMEMGNRRRHDRLPCDLSLTFFTTHGLVTGRAIDLSEGGMLARTDTDTDFATGTPIDVKIEGIGRCPAVIITRSAIGLHVKWLDPSPDFVTALRVTLTQIRDSYADLVTEAIDVAASVGRAMEDVVTNGLLTMETLFDAEYESIEGTDPPQCRNRALSVLESILPPILNRVRDSNASIVFCVALDRNAWMPVHHPQYSQPQRPGEYDWNVMHSRNRRIIDDRAALSAARNTRPSLIQVYNRNVGGGKFVLLKEVDAPIHVFGRHWGGLRIGYTR